MPAKKKYADMTPAERKKHSKKRLAKLTKKTSTEAGKTKLAPRTAAHAAVAKKEAVGLGHIKGTTAAAMWTGKKKKKEK